MNNFTRLPGEVNLNAARFIAEFGHHDKQLIQKPDRFRGKGAS